MGPPDPRVYLAAERTFLAWIRTGVALMGFGFIAARFSLFLRYGGTKESVDLAGSEGFSLSGGVTLIILGVIINVCAAVRHYRQIRSIDKGEFRKAFGSTLAFSIAGALCAIGVALGLYLFSLSR